MQGGMAKGRGGGKEGLTFGTASSISGGVGDRLHLYRLNISCLRSPRAEGEVFRKALVELTCEVRGPGMPRSLPVLGGSSRCLMLGIPALGRHLPPRPISPQLALPQIPLFPSTQPPVGR